MGKVKQKKDKGKIEVKRVKYMQNGQKSRLKKIRDE
jgi:hypothetical protein